MGKQWSTMSEKRNGILRTEKAKGRRTKTEVKMTEDFS